MATQNPAQSSTQQNTSAQSSTPQTTSANQQRGTSTGIERRSVLPSVPSLLLDPLGFFGDNPFSMMRRIQQEMNRLLAQSDVSGELASRDTAARIWAPPVEVYYQDGKLVVSAELPGLTEKDVRVDIQNDALIIQGERKEEHEEKRGGIRRSEIRYGQFYRAIALPEGADPEQANAEFQNGVLRVTIPVSQKNTRQIPVQASASSTGTQSPGQKQPASETRSSERAA